MPRHREGRELTPPEVVQSALALDQASAAQSCSDRCRGSPSWSLADSSLKSTRSHKFARRNARPHTPNSPVGTTTRAAPIAHIPTRSLTTVAATILAMVLATILAAMVLATMGLATAITADRASELVSARSASASGGSDKYGCCQRSFPRRASVFGLGHRL
jgi:hypothetical protein